MSAAADGSWDLPSPNWPAPGQDDARGPADQAQDHSSGRCLIVLPGEDRSEQALGRTGRPLAPFLAQLIATALAMPQTRARRRAEPGDAQSTYAAAAAHPARAGTAVYRSM